MKIHPAASLQGSIEVPGDKSISHRYAILGAMAEGETRIEHYSSSRDCQSTLHCLSQLGVEISRRGPQVVLNSPGWKGFRAPTQPLDAENSGTSIRLISALLAARPFRSTIAGDSSLNRRPMKRIITPLQQMGAQIQAREGEFPPLTIQGSSLHGISYIPPVASAQVKSCVLLAGLTASGHTRLREPIPTRDHTERALPCFGGSIQREGDTWVVPGPQHLQGARLRAPGDLSSAVFFVAAALLLPGAHVQIRRVGLNPTRCGLLDLLRQAGAPVQVKNLREEHCEPVGDLEVHFSDTFLTSFPAEVGGRWIPALIDEIPILAILGTRCRQGLVVRDAGELRKKESDRIHALTVNLRSLGIEVEEQEDGFSIPPGQPLRGGRIRTFGDHRIAMAFSVAALICREPVELDDPDCVAVSFPEFFDTLESLQRSDTPPAS